MNKKILIDYKKFFQKYREQITQIIILSLIICILIVNLLPTKVHPSTLVDAFDSAPIDITFYIDGNLTEEELQHNIDTLKKINSKEISSYVDTVSSNSFKPLDASEEDYEKMALLIGSMSEQDIDIFNQLSHQYSSAAIEDFPLYEKYLNEGNTEDAETLYFIYNISRNTFRAFGDEYSSSFSQTEQMAVEQDKDYVPQTANQQGLETTEAIEKSEEDMGQYYIYLLLDSIAFQFARSAYGILDSLLDSTRLNLTQFGLLDNVKIPDGHDSAGLPMMTSMGELWQLIISRFAIAGGIMATLIFAFNLFMCFFQKTSELKHTPVQILSRYAITMVIMYGLGNVTALNSILQIFRDMMSQCFFVSGHAINPYVSSGSNTTLAGVGTAWSLADLCLLDVKSLIENGTSPSYPQILTALGIVATLPFGLGGWVVVFLIFLISLPLIKQLLKLLLEIIERFLALMFFICIAPFAVSFSVSKNSSSVTISYLKLVFCQTLLLLCNGIGLYGFTQIIIANGIANSSIMGYIFAITYLIFAQRMDSYLQAMGLSVAHTGGGVLDNCALAFRNGMAMAKGAGRTLRGGARVANEGRKVVGAGMLLGGIATGNKTLAKAGAIAGITTKGIKNSAMDGLGGFASNQRVANMMGATGTEMRKANNREVMYALSKCVNNPISKNQDTVRGYGDKNIAKTLSSALGGNPSINHIDKNRLKNGELGFNASYGSGSTARSTDMKISSAPSANSLEMVDGNGNLTGMYLSSQNSLSNGDTLVRNDAGGITASSMMSLTGVQNLADTNLGFNHKDVHSVTNNNGQLGYMDKAGKLLGVQDTKTGHFSKTYKTSSSGGGSGSGKGKGKGSKTS